jgi:hypothetical protein
MGPKRQDIEGLGQRLISGSFRHEGPGSIPVHMGYVVGKVLQAARFPSTSSTDHQGQLQQNHSSSINELDQPLPLQQQNKKQNSENTVFVCRFARRPILNII